MKYDRNLSDLRLAELARSAQRHRGIAELFSTWTEIHMKVRPWEWVLMALAVVMFLEYLWRQ